MEYRIIAPDATEYPTRLRQRLSPPPPLGACGPLGLLSRFCMAVVASDSIPARAVLAANDVLFCVRDYAMNYVGGWHSVFETEVFRLALDRKRDPGCQRTLTAITARGLARETAEEFLADRFGREGPFIDFPQKPEFFRQVKSAEILWLSATDPDEPGMPPAAVTLRNQVACALADAVFIPYAARDSRALAATRWTVERGIPAFTTEAEDNARLWEAGVRRVTRKTVGTLLEKLGARLISPGGSGSMPPSGEQDVRPPTCEAPGAPQHAERRPRRPARGARLPLLL